MCAWGKSESVISYSIQTQLLVRSYQKSCSRSSHSLLFHLIDRHTLLIILDVNEGGLELPGRNSAIEQDVTLTIRAVLELRKEEERHHPADASRSSPDVAALACEIPSRRIEQLRGQVDHGDLRDIVGGATYGGAQGAKADRGRLGDDGV